MISLSIETNDALKQVEVLFDDLDEALDTEEILDEAATVMVSRTLRRFRAMQTPDGRAWKQSEAAKIRQSGGYTYSNGKRVTGGQTLFATGRLFQSFDLIDNMKGERRIVNTAPYAIYLNYANNGQWQFIGASEQDIQLMVNIVNDRIERALR
ncbi:neck protein [Vibrio phage V-YDF132]|nr:neck protein [Vibrio phage V-YDF132]